MSKDYDNLILTRFLETVYDYVIMYENFVNPKENRVFFLVKDPIEAYELLVQNRKNNEGSFKLIVGSLKLYDAAGRDSENYCKSQYEKGLSDANIQVAKV